jgi:hypothetical protein
MEAIEAKRKALRELTKQFKPKSTKQSKSAEVVLLPYKAEIRELYLRKKATFVEIAVLLKQVGFEVSPKAVGRFYRSHIQKPELPNRLEIDVPSE